MKQVSQAVGAIASCLSVAAAFAQAPVVSDVVMTQDANRKVTVTYRLDRPAVVTLGIETNVSGTADWVSIGGENLTHVTGDANVFVRETDSSVVHTIRWEPCVAWPNHRIKDGGVRAVVRAWAPEAPPDWMLIDLSLASNVHYYASLGELPHGHPTNSVYKLDKMLMRKIPAAGRSFRMGISSGEARQYEGKGDDFLTVSSQCEPRLVSFTNDYYIAIYPFTQHQYFNCMDENPPGYDQDKVAPYDECPQAYLSYARLRGEDKATANWPTLGHSVGPGYRIDAIRRKCGVEVDFPTEAQWEYACRAGEPRLRPDGACLYTDAGLDAIAWHSGNSGGKIHPVGLKAPNAWGLYDMIGNGAEWVLDWYRDGYGGCGTLEPIGPDSPRESGLRVLRGGTQNADARYMTSFYRSFGFEGSYDAMTSVTFRLAAPAVAK